jgi:hypothetical protein
MKVYLGKDRQRTAQHITATHTTVTELTRKIEGCVHKLNVDCFFLFPELCDDLAKKQIYFCGTVRPNRRGMLQDLAPKTTKLKRGDICVRTRTDLTAILSQDKRKICVLTDIHGVPAEGYIFSERGKVIKLQIVIDYSIIWATWVRVTEWQTVFPSAVTHSNRQKKIVLLSVRPGQPLCIPDLHRKHFTLVCIAICYII